MLANAGNPETQSALRIMPLGGSITYGSESSDANGYRQALRKMLISDGFSVEMLGSRKAGTMNDNANEGWRGYRIDQVARKAEASVSRLRPDLFLVNVGSNDCVQDFEIENAAQRISCMINYLWEAVPRSTIILSTLLVNLDEAIESRVLQVNTQLRKLAEEKLAEERKLVLAEMHGPGGVPLCDLADGTHPNDDGYMKMARIWHESIREAVQRGFIHKPSTN